MGDHMLVAALPDSILFQPGFLLEPLDWVFTAFAGTILKDRHLLIDLCSINTPRVHLLAIGALHAPKPVSSSFIRYLMREPPQAVMRTLGLSWPIGFSAVLNKLPNHALEPDLYRHLLGLLNHPMAAKLLHHRKNISASLVRGLASLSDELRTWPIISLFAGDANMENLTTGLEALAERSDMPFADLVTLLASHRQKAQVVACIGNLVERLPLPDMLPPVRIGGFRRLDQPSELRSYGRAWSNCLAEYTLAVEDGTSAIYLNDSERPQAVAMVTRCGRFGWHLDDIRARRTLSSSRPFRQTPRVVRRRRIGLARDLTAIRSILLHYRWSVSRVSLKRTN